jgi:tetratricopeptide (TPR) repeat protein
MLNPNSIYPYRNIAYILTQQNKFDLALEYYTNALELKEQEHILYKLRGKCYEKLGRDSDAKLDYELASKFQG